MLRDLPITKTVPIVPDKIVQERRDCCSSGALELPKGNYRILRVVCPRGGIQPAQRSDGAETQRRPVRGEGRKHPSRGTLTTLRRSG